MWPRLWIKKLGIFVDVNYAVFSDGDLFKFHPHSQTGLLMNVGYNHPSDSDLPSKISILYKGAHAQTFASGSQNP